jgi:hypothetical protein
MFAVAISTEHFAIQWTLATSRCIDPTLVDAAALTCTAAVEGQGCDERNAYESPYTTEALR